MDKVHQDDLKKFCPNASKAHIDAIVKHLGVAMQSRDAQMVACSSNSELERVRESWLKRKLKLTQTDAELDAAIKKVCATMKDTNQKSRVAFYYLLAEHYNKLDAI